MAIKKSDLYNSLWKSCDELRGGMDASQYKDYVLVLLFVKYVSDKYANNPNALIDVPVGGSFADMVAAKGDKEIGDRLNKIIAKLADANDNLKGAINVADFNDEEKLGKGKEMVDRLTKLVAIFEGLDFGRNRAGGDDLLGDAYEYLMRHFATESGKSKGQFYTPAEVSRVMSQVIGLGQATRADQSIYDPTCGSGSLLLKAHDEAKSRTGLDLALYGQEMDNATSALARMNMVLHDCPTAEIWQANTLAAPHFTAPDGSLKTFDYVVANPPFSNKNWTSGLAPNNDLYARFEYGIPPAKNGDYAFLLHMLKSLKSTGKAAVILPHGVLFRGGAEGTIRTRIIKQGYIKGIIGLPANLFYGTGIPACIIILDKEGAPGRKGIFMMDASRGFMKDGPKNRLREQDIHKIVDIFRKGEDVERYARMVPLAEIEKNAYNLNLPRYIESTEQEDLQDIDAHLNGGIPDHDLDALAEYWQVLPGVRKSLFAPLRTGYARLLLPFSEVKGAILDHAEFTAFTQSITHRFSKWQEANIPRLKGIKKNDHPKALIESLAEDLLITFKDVPLLDAYDIYQHLMDYWAETMQDDVYLIASDGWVAQPQRIVEADKNGKTKDKGWTCDLIPKTYIVARYFANEQAAIDVQLVELEALVSQRTELEEEYGGDEGYFGALDKIGKAEVNSRLKEIKHDPDAKDETVVINQWLKLNIDEIERKRAIREAESVLDARAFQKYAELSVEEIKTLVVNDKWLPQLSAAVHGELERVSQILTGRLRELAERYDTPLPKLAQEVTELSIAVEAHLKQMGVLCK